jgi:hypothetical protein
MAKDGVSYMYPGPPPPEKCAKCAGAGWVTKTVNVHKIKLGDREIVGMEGPFSFPPGPFTVRFVAEAGDIRTTGEMDCEPGGFVPAEGQRCKIWFPEIGELEGSIVSVEKIEG